MRYRRKKFTFAISSPDEFLYTVTSGLQAEAYDVLGFNSASKTFGHMGELNAMPPMLKTPQMTGCEVPLVLY